MLHYISSKYLLQKIRLKYKIIIGILNIKGMFKK